MRTGYEKPPLIDVVCEFLLEPNQPWDWTIPGLVYSHIKDEFPKKRELKLVELQFRPEQKELAQSLKGTAGRMQFLREDGRAMIQVGPDYLSANHLRPYPGWDSFKKIASQALAVYREVAAPKGIARIGLRFVNRIGIPGARVQIEDYLSVYPKVPDAVPQLFAAFLQRIDIPFEKNNGLLILQVGMTEPTEGEGVAFILDLDFGTLNAKNVPIDSAMEWIEQAHEQTEYVFESCLTEKARKLFGERKLV